jgi:hypothetical protein
MHHDDERDQHLHLHVHVEEPVHVQLHGTIHLHGQGDIAERLVRIEAKLDGLIDSAGDKIKLAALKKEVEAHKATLAAAISAGTEGEAK